MFDRETIDRFLHSTDPFFNEEENLMCHIDENNQKYHDICFNARYASYVISLKFEKYYERAEKIILRVLSLQDCDESSSTYGVWSYFLEQNLDDVGYVDYNVADFIAKTFLDVLIRNPEAVSETAKNQIKIGLRRALESIIRRNIAPDYTNISIIGSMNLISAGELLGDERYFNIGKKRLKKLYEYTKFNTAFSEYNSSDYALLDVEEISRMLDFFKDEEARKIAEELNYYAWDMITSHFNTHINQLSPPQSRAYIDLEKGRINALIYLGTKGKYGKLDSIDKIAPPWLIVGLRCPKECEENLKKNGERWIEHTYYRKNSIITPDEERAIILDNDCPDMTARTYMTDTYSIGSFSVSDLWRQRRTCMVLWGKEKPCYLRLRGIKDDKDFCSALVYASQYKNTILANLGFATDRGDWHYNIDGYKNTVYKAEKLYFKFELGGCTDSVTVTQNDNEFLFTDGETKVRLCIHNWIFDGVQGEIHYNKEEKSVELICFEGENREFDLSKLAKTYGVFTLSVNETAENIPKTNEWDDMVHCSLKTNQKTLRVSSSFKPTKYNEATEKSNSVSEEGGYQ